MPIRRAADSRISVGGVLLAVRTYRQRTVSPPTDVSNTEGIPGGANGGPLGGGAPAALSDAGTVNNRRSFLGDIKGAVYELTCFYDDSNDALQPPYGLVAEGYTFVTWFPAGFGGFSYGPHNVLVSEVDHSGEVGQGAQSVKFVLYTDGEFNLTPY